jgi:Uma2 family endonuclease
MLNRAAKYFEAGAEEVWLIYPNRREIHQFRNDEPEVRVYRGDEVVDTSVLFPGLSLRAGTIFTIY